MAPQVLTQDEIDERLRTMHPAWTGTPEKLSRAIEFADFLTAVEFINQLAPRCEELDHHPDLTLRWRKVRIEQSTHSVNGVTEFDMKLAAIIDELAAQLPQVS